MHYYSFIGNGILRTSVAKNLNGSGRQILLKIPEVDNTISDKIGGGGRGKGGGGREKGLLSSSSLFICHERICCFVNWPLVIGYWVFNSPDPQRTHFNDLLE